jgi:hypothetical protein
MAIFLNLRDMCDTKNFNKARILAQLITKISNKTLLYLGNY